MYTIPLWINFISGILLTYDLFPKTGVWKQFHDRIGNRLKRINTEDPSSWEMIVFNAIVSGFVFLMILGWAYYKTRNTPDAQPGWEIAAYAVGSLIAFCIFVFITKITKKPTVIFGWG